MKRMFDAPLSIAGTMAAPFPWFGGKSNACEKVWGAFGIVDNYVEPFSGSAAMLIGAPNGKRVETINDADGFVSNFWRAISKDPDAVADHADWPCNENDLFARHSWLVRQTQDLTTKLHADPEWFDAKIAGWWCWGACNWIGSGWCSGGGPWVHDGETIVNNRQLPHLSAGQGINRQLPHLGNAGRGDRRQFIFDWFNHLYDRLRDVRVCCGDWSRVCKDSVTTRHGLTGIFFDPPYTKGSMNYAAGGVGTDLPMQVQEWCAKNGNNKLMRLVLCGHKGEHDALLKHGWTTRTWVARSGYATTEEAKENSAGETLWCSPHCIQENQIGNLDLFS